jgi:hypothetical protein
MDWLSFGAGFAIGIIAMWMWAILAGNGKRPRGTGTEATS